MNKKDKKLFEQLVSQMAHSTRESLLQDFARIKTKYDEMDFNPEKTPRRIALRENRTDILLFIHYPHDIIDVGLLESYRSGDMKSLHDALYTYSCSTFQTERTYDHPGPPYIHEGEYIFCRNIIESFASCTLNLIRKYCPPDVPILTNGYRMWYVGYNLILGMLYKDEKRLAIGIQQAEKGLTRKNPQFDTAVMSYLLALAKNDAEEANRQFAAMMSTYRRSGILEFHDPFLKIFAFYPHGLYNMAHEFLSESDFTKIVPPQDTAFWPELADYQRKKNFSRGEPFLEFNGELNVFDIMYS